LLCGRAAAKVAANVERAYAAVVISGVQDSVRFVYREVVRSRSRDMVKRDLSRRRRIADVDNVDVTIRRRPNGSRTLFADERVALRAVRRVVIPPDVVDLATHGLDTADDSRILRRPAAARAASAE